MSTIHTLTIKDLSVTQELDRKAMAGVCGGESKKAPSNSVKQKAPSTSEYLVFTFSDVLISDYPAPD